MHYVFQAWFINFLTEALAFPASKHIAEKAGVTDRTLRNYNKVPLNESLKPYIKLLKGFVKSGVFKEDGAEASIETIESGGFQGFYYENLYRQISSDEPRLLKFIHYSVCFLDSWNELADLRNASEDVRNNPDNDFALQWLKGQYPYNEFDLDVLFRIYLGAKGGNKGKTIRFEIGFVMLAALELDLNSACHKKYTYLNLLELTSSAREKNNIVSDWFKYIRDELFEGTKEEFYREFSKHAIVSGGLNGDHLMDTDDAKRTYIRMSKSGKADWKQIERISNTIKKDDPELLMSLLLQFALLRCVDYYISELTSAEITVDHATLVGWWKKWKQNLLEHHPKSINSGDA